MTAKYKISTAEAWFKDTINELKNDPGFITEQIRLELWEMECQLDVLKNIAQEIRGVIDAENRRV